MELRQLKYFVKLAETLNFSTASKELFISQSTLSHQILQLENELQQPLFQRNSHEVILTEAGLELLLRGLFGRRDHGVELGGEGIAFTGVTVDQRLFGRGLGAEVDEGGVKIREPRR